TDFWNDGQNYPDACDTAMVGTVADGGACVVDYDCSNVDSICDPTTSKCGPDTSGSGSAAVVRPRLQLVQSHWLARWKKIGGTPDLRIHQSVCRPNPRCSARARPRAVSVGKKWAARRFLRIHQSACRPNRLSFDGQTLVHSSGQRIPHQVSLR